MLGGWLDQVGIRLTQLSTGLKVEAELGKNQTSDKNKLSHAPNYANANPPPPALLPFEEI